MPPSDRDARPCRDACFASARLRLAIACALIAAPAASAAPTSLGQYGVGTEGGTAGQLQNPSGVALDAAGNVYVADRLNHRISTFDAQGGFVRTSGFDVIAGNANTGFEICTTNCKAGVPGGGAGQLNTPIEIEADAAGNVYVAEFENHRVSIFDAQGTFTRAFGFDVDPGGGTGFEICTTTCKAGVAGGGPGQLTTPRGVALDAAGNLYVAERDAARISVFNSQQQFLRAFGFNVIPGNPQNFEICTTDCKTGVAGSAAGQLFGPRGLTVDPAGNLHVVDNAIDRIATYNAQNAFVRAFGFDVIPGNAETGYEICTAICKLGVAGGAAGQLDFTNGIEADAAGNLHVGDFNNSRIGVYTGSGRVPCARTGST